MAASRTSCGSASKTPFCPTWPRFPAEIARRAKLMWLNYPNNPTAATAERAFLKDAVDFCLRHNIILAHDFAYSEIAFDGYRAPSVLEIDGARECAVEFHSLSKTYSMTGWRVGFVVGNAAAGRRDGQGQDQYRLGRLPGGAGGGDRGASRAARRSCTNTAPSTSKDAT